MKHKINIIICLIYVSLLGLTQSCSDFLDEKPMSLLSTDEVLSSEDGFENYITALHKAARDEMTARDQVKYFYIMQAGTDVASFGHVTPSVNDYYRLLTPGAEQIAWVWDWAYRDMILQCNTIITYAENPQRGMKWSSEEKKNAIIAEAKFFRAYTYNMLANLYGGVPLVDVIYESPKTDFFRSTRDEILEFVKDDLEFASQWLPETVVKEKEGRIVKAAADHLLTEVCISLKLYDHAISSASNVIDSGLYQLMRERFGSEKDLPGDVFSDLFRDGNQNRSSGNLESIYVWQIEDMTEGGQGGSNGNNRLRNWGPWYTRLTDPNGRSGMVAVDSLGQGGGQVRPTPYFLYQIWNDNWDNDIRNSIHNIRREFRYTNPKSIYFGKLVEPKTAEVDTMQNIYPQIRKIEGNKGELTNTGVPWMGRTYQDFMVYRLAETYLLRAEAYFRKGNLEKAAKDINEVRSRSNAKLITPNMVTLDYILDERARELITEEPRRRTLVRTGTLVERVRKYSIRQITRTSIADFHQWWPIPQSAIDSNIGLKLEQNEGY